MIIAVPGISPGSNIRAGGRKAIVKNEEYENESITEARSKREYTGRNETVHDIKKHK